jgi:hypothetical protein
VTDNGESFRPAPRVNSSEFGHEDLVGHSLLSARRAAAGTLTEEEWPRRPDRGEAPLDDHLAYVNGCLRVLARRQTLPRGIEGLRVMPAIYPGRTIGPDTYGDQTGSWGDGVVWLTYWAGLGSSWVNLGIAHDEEGPFIESESQWRKGDPIEPLPDGRYPAFNFHG